MMFATSSPQLSVIIVSWNVAGLLRDCLQSLTETRADLSLEIIVVDSASSDDTVEMVRRDFPHVQLLAQTENVGFARGNNLGMAVARGAFLFLLNPDTVVHEGALVQLVTYLQTHPQVGLVGPQLFNTDGSHQSSRRRLPTVWTAFWESMWWQRYAPPGVLRRYYMEDRPISVECSVDWLSGAALCVRKSIVQQVGGFDPAYFMYSEELDWCRRIGSVGWQIVYLPTAHVTHHIGRSSQQAVTSRHINFNRAKLRYIRKYHGNFPYQLIRLAILLGFCQQLLIEGAKWLVGHQRPLRRQRIASYLRVIASRMTAAGYRSA